VPDLLQAIVSATRRIVLERKLRESEARLEARACSRAPDAGRFRTALTANTAVNVIAECKRRSPSRGVLRAGYDPVAIAASYESAGAAALSVLTEPTFFDGSLEDLAAVRAAVKLPLLRKDFIIDHYQLLEARAYGADAVLLIVAALSDRQLHQLHRAARTLGLAVVVEAHDVAEVDRAIAAGADIVGINNRNLRTLDVDMTASAEAATRIPSDVIAISESGLKTADDLIRMRALGYRAFLIGERLMTASDPGSALRTLLESLRGPDQHPRVETGS
jgi:indole-3-glycerol phosphate synthase